LRSLLQPFYFLLANSAQKDVVHRVKQFFGELLNWKAGSNEKTFSTDLQFIITDLFELASSSDTFASNRNQIYELHSLYSSQNALLMQSAQPTKTDNDLQVATGSLDKQKEGGEKRKSAHKKRSIKKRK